LQQELLVIYVINITLHSNNISLGNSITRKNIEKQQKIKKSVKKKTKKHRIQHSSPKQFKIKIKSGNNNATKNLQNIFRKSDSTTLKLNDGAMSFFAML
jgi:hypothetical protein